jgi:hypothetical protein
VGIVILYYIGGLAAVRRTRYHIDTHDRRYPYARGYAQRGVLNHWAGCVVNFNNLDVSQSLAWTSSVDIPAGDAVLQGTAGISCIIT